MVFLRFPVGCLGEKRMIRTKTITYDAAEWLVQVRLLAHEKVREPVQGFFPRCVNKCVDGALICFNRI